MVSAYDRVEYLAATLDAYRESGAGLYDLAYGRRTLDSLSSVLGGRGALYRPIDFGVVSPGSASNGATSIAGRADNGSIMRILVDGWPTAAGSGRCGGAISRKF